MSVYRTIGPLVFKFRLTRAIMYSSHLYPLLYVYTWKQVREHLLCYEGKLWTNFFLQSKYVLTNLLNLPKFVVSKVASA